MARASTQVTPIALTGGLNLAAAPIAQQAGEAQILHNYTHDVLGRYERVTGFVRFDGQPSPEEQEFVVIRVDPDKVEDFTTGTKVVGQTSGADGEVLFTREGETVLINIRGAFEAHEMLAVEGVIKHIELQAVMPNASFKHVSVTQNYRKEVRDHYRTDIKAVPGIGPIRGVTQFFGVVYAWRDNPAETETVMWGSTPQGWVKVPSTPPRIYSPPYPYDYLIHAGSAGDSDATFKCGYFRTAPWYGEVLLPSDASLAQEVVDISFRYIAPDQARITFDPGVPLGDMWQLMIYVEDELMYRLNSDLATIVQPEPGHTDYHIDVPVPVFDPDPDPDDLVPDPRPLWLAGQKVGFQFTSVADKPLPETDVWTLTGPSTVAEGQPLSIHITCVQADSYPAVNREIKWHLEGITADDLASGALTGTVNTDGTGVADIAIDLKVDGILENETLKFVMETPAKNIYTHSVKLLDTHPPGTHTYAVSGPSGAFLGDPISYTVDVTNMVGEKVVGQELTYELTGVPEADVDGPLTGTLVTGTTGGVVLTLTVLRSSAATGMVFHLLTPVTQERSTTLKAPPLPDGVVPGPTPDRNGTYYAMRLSRPWVASDAPVKVTIYTLADRNGRVKPNYPFTVGKQHIANRNRMTGSTPKMVRTPAGTEVLTSDENGEATFTLSAPQALCDRVIYRYVHHYGADHMTLYATAQPYFLLRVDVPLTTAGGKVPLGQVNTRIVATQPNPDPVYGQREHPDRTSPMGASDAPLEGDPDVITIALEDAAAPPADPWRVDVVAAAAVPRSDIGLHQRHYSWLPGGKFKTKKANFSGGISVGLGGINLYGVDGVNPAWIFDGVSVKFIETGLALSGFIDRPNSLAILPTQSLALGYKEGSLLLSSIGDPGEFEVSKGAAEIAVSDEIIDLAVQPSEVLTIFCKSSVKMLTGKTHEEMQLSVYSERLALTPWSLQPLGDSIFLTDDGITRLSRVQEFGDFRDMPLSVKVKPLLDSLQRRVLCSWVVADRNEYRILFEGGLGVVIKFSAAEVLGIGTFDYGTEFNIVNSSEGVEGHEEIYAGGLDDGFVYRLEQGDSFDGGPIESILTLAYDFMGSVENRKRVKKIQLEVDTPESAKFLVRGELDYASPEAPALFPHEVLQSGGGGYYDLSYFREILWAGERYGVGDVYVQGVGRNIAVTVYSKTDREPPHILSSLILHWSPRGRRR